MTELIADDELRKYIIDPKDLTQAEREALERIHVYFLRRMHNGYGLRGQRKITPLGVVNRLMNRKLVRIHHGGRGGNSLELTSHGREVLAVIRERKRK